MATRVPRARRIRATFGGIGAAARGVGTAGRIVGAAVGAAGLTARIRGASARRVRGTGCGTCSLAGDRCRGLGIAARGARRVVVEGRVVPPLALEAVKDPPHHAAPPLAGGTRFVSAWPEGTSVLTFGAVGLAVAVLTGVDAFPARDGPANEARVAVVGTDVLLVRERTRAPP
jgi:hypothetical protein